MTSIHLCPIILRMSNINNWITKYFEDGKFHFLNRIFIFVCQDGYVRSWMYYLLQQWNGCFLSHHKWGNYLSWIFQVNGNAKSDGYITRQKSHTLLSKTSFYSLIDSHTRNPNDLSITCWWVRSNGWSSSCCFCLGF